MLPLFLTLTVISFSITHLAPGDPVLLFVSETQIMDKEIIERMRSEMHLDEPIWIQYFQWLRGILTLDLGHSFVTRLPVSEVVVTAARNTARLMSISLLLTVVVSIPIGVICAVKQGSRIDNMLRPVILFGVSMPTFWLALLLITLFSVILGWLPTSGIRTLGSPPSLIDELRHMVLPSILLTAYSSAFLIRLTRSGMLEVLSKEYIVTARSKGLRERIVVYKHALRNALLPIVTAIGMSIGTLLNGAVITETVFGWPGMGRLVVESSLTRDYPVLMATILITGLLVSVANLGTDISYAYLDPRIKY